tara:strand:- start:3890 stop:4354 length:465 start_codon:yes stop_codon:yes gene_type:complete
MSEDQVILQSQDGQDFQVEVRVATMSETVKNLIQDAGIDAPVPLPGVTGKILEKIVDYMKYHTEHPTIENKEDEVIAKWDLDFCKVDQPTLFEMILAANYLDIKGLLDLTCKTVANMIKGKTPEEIRITFGIKSDFSEAEQEQVRKENEWIEER